MEQFAKEIKRLLTEFESDMTANIEKGNKAAGKRARKASLELEKKFRIYRKKSCETAEK